MEVCNLIAKGIISSLFEILLKKTGNRKLIEYINVLWLDGLIMMR